MTPQTMDRRAGSADPESSTVRRRAWLITAMLVGFMIINWADKTVLGLAAKPMMKELGLTPEQYGMAASSFFFLFSASTVIGGFLLTRVRTTWMLLTMAIAWSVIQVPMALTTSLGLIIAARVALGIAEGPATTTALHAAMKWFPDDRRDVPNSLVMAGAALGLVVAAPILGLVIGEWGWRSAFVVMAVVGVVWSVAWMVIGREGPYVTGRPAAHSHDAVDEESPTGAALNEPRVPYRILFTTPTWIAFTFACFAAYWTASLLISWVPAYTETVLGLSTAQAGSLIAIAGAVGGVAMFCQGLVTRRLLAMGAGTRWARAGVGAASVLASGLLVLGFTLATSGGLQLVALVLAFALGAPCLSVATAWIAEISPVRQRGAALGVMLGIQTTAGIIAPFVTGHLVGAAASPADGYHAAFGVGAAFLLTAAVGLVLFARPDRDRARILAHSPES